MSTLTKNDPARKLGTYLAGAVIELGRSDPKVPNVYTNDNAERGIMAFDLPNESEADFHAMGDRMLAAANSQGVSVKSGDVVISLDNASPQVQIAFKIVTHLEAALKNDGKIDAGEGKQLLADALELANPGQLAEDALGLILGKLGFGKK